MRDLVLEIVGILHEFIDFQVLDDTEVKFFVQKLERLVVDFCEHRTDQIRRRFDVNMDCGDLGDIRTRHEGDFV